MAKPNGYVIYRGPSELDGAPIVVIATGFASKSTNVKTGALIQTWIIREDCSPLEAVHNGDDASVCGDCPHRGKLVTQPDGSTRNKLRTCYVLEFQAPLSVWRAYHRGSYVDATGWNARDIEALFSGRTVRLGSYGDPGAAPVRVWALATTLAAKWAGYTHQWRREEPGSLLSTLCMASADNAEEASEAQARGWRTFRVGGDVFANEVSCPASEEMGKVSTCAKCGLCAGTFRQAKNIVIRPHGSRNHSEFSDKGRRLATV